MPPLRDDDPVHPDFSGIQFQADTGKTGVIIRPECGNTLLVATFLPLAEAFQLHSDLRGLVTFLRKTDPKSYVATFFETVADDLNDALNDCGPTP